MRPLPADHSSRAFTLFQGIFRLVGGRLHFASRCFHDLNLLSYQTLIIIIFTRMDKANKKKSKKPTKKIATPTFNADINLDQEEPDIPEKVEKVEVDQISIVKKVGSKVEAQPLIVVKEERVQPFYIEEGEDNSMIKQGKDGESKVNQQVHVPMNLIQDIVPQELAKSIIQEPSLQQKMKQQQAYQPQPLVETSSHTFQPVHLASTTIEKQVQAKPRQQPIKSEKGPNIKNIVLEDDQQDQLALSLKEDPKSKAKTSKKTTKKPKTKSKAAASAIFAVQNMLDLDEFNENQEVKAKSQIIAHVEEKRQETIKENIEVKLPQLANHQQQKPAEPEIMESRANEIVAETQFKQQPLEHSQLNNMVEANEQEEKIAKVVVEQDKSFQHIQEPQTIKQQIAVRQQNKEEVKELAIPASTIEEEVQSQIPFSLQDSKPKPKNIKKNTKKGGKKPKVDKKKQLTEESIFDVKEIQQNELPKEQIASQNQMDIMEKTQEPKQQQKAEKDIEIIEQKQEQIVPIFVQAEQNQKQVFQQLQQSNQTKATQQKEVEFSNQLEKEAEPAFTQQPVVVAQQQRPIIEQPVTQPPRHQAPLAKNEAEEEQEIQSLSLADPLKPKTNKAGKKPSKKQKTKPKEEKNAMIGGNLLSFDLEVVKNEYPQKQEENIEKAEEITQPISIAQIVQKEVKQQPNEQISQQQPLHKIIQPPLVIPQKLQTKPIQKPQQVQSFPPVVSSAPKQKKEIVSQLISLIRFHNDQQIKTMRQRMQMLQEDILSRMSRSKPSCTIRAPKRPDYQWIIQENIQLHGQYKSLNKN